jgi:hypothetical protein
VKKHAPTIVLLLVAVALGLWLWLDRDRPTEGERARRPNSVFAVWRRDELSRVEIAHEGETIVLQRDAAKDSAWRMTSPRAERCDQQAVERLLTTLEFALAKRKASEEGQLGLDAPRATGNVTMGGLVLRFALGGPSPRPENTSYFRVEGEGPVVVTKELADDLLAPSDTYRDRSVVPYLSIELARFEVRRAGGGFGVERSGEHDFKVIETGVAASRARLDEVWAALAEMRAEAFPKDADADRLTAAPRITIVMTPKDKAKPPAELVVGEACPGHPDDVVVLRKTPSRVAACAPKGAIAALEIAPSRLDELHPFTLHADEIEELRLEQAGKKAIEIARKGVGWHEREPTDRELPAPEAEAASELVTRIVDSTADVVTRGGSEPFTAVARAKVHAGERDETIEVGAPNGEGRVVLRRALDGARLEVSAAVARRFVPRDTSLAPRTLLDDARRPERVILRCGTPQELADTGAGFRYVEPKDLPADGSIVQLVDAVMRGKIDAWVADAPEPGMGLSTEGCRVVFGFAGGNAPVTLRLGAEGEGGIYGTIDAKPGVFVAPKSLRELASAIYVSKAALRIPEEQIASVKVLRDGKPFTPPAPPEALREAFSGFFAERAFSLGARSGPSFGPELSLVAVVADGGPTRTVRCGPVRPGGARLCSGDVLPDVLFEFSAARLAPFLGDADAGTVAPDGGPR